MLNKKYRDKTSITNLIIGLFFLIFTVMVLFGLINGMPIQMFLAFVLLIIFTGGLFSLSYFAKVRIGGSIVQSPGYQIIKMNSVSDLKKNTYDIYRNQNRHGSINYNNPNYTYIFTLDNISGVDIKDKGVIIKFKKPLTYRNMLGNSVTKIVKTLDSDTQKTFDEIKITVAKPEELANDLRTYSIN